MNEDKVSSENEKPQEILKNKEKPFSKKQLKKQKKAQEYLIKKAERRKNERLKRKAKRAEKVLNNEDLGPSKKKLKSNTMANSACKIRVAVDCSFDDLMTDRDITKLCQQLQYCYAKNRRAADPIQLYMTNVEGKTLSRLEEIGFYKSWDVHIKRDSFTDLFNKNDVVYLSSESPNMLEELREENVYIIGGLVDHNHHKGLCYKMAQEKGFAHAQLPISNFLQLASRNVLAVNHVFEILLKFTEKNVWKDAFFSVIPKRKIASNEVNDQDDNHDNNLADNIDEDNKSYKVDSDVSTIVESGCENEENVTCNTIENDLKCHEEKMTLKCCQNEDTSVYGECNNSDNN